MERVRAYEQIAGAIVSFVVIHVVDFIRPWQQGLHIEGGCGYALINYMAVDVLTAQLDRGVVAQMACSGGMCSLWMEWQTHRSCLRTSANWLEVARRSDGVDAMEIEATLPLSSNSTR